MLIGEHMEPFKKSSSKRKSDTEHEGVSKKQKKTTFTEDNFRKHLKDEGIVYSGLEKFIEQVKLYPNDSDYDLVASFCETSCDMTDIVNLLVSLSSKSKPEFATDVAHKVNLVLECLQLILIRIADDLVEYQTSVSNLVVRRLVKPDCLKVIVSQLKAHNKVEHIKSAMLLLTTLCSVSSASAMQVLMNFDIISQHLLAILHRKYDPADVKSSVVQFVVSFFIGGHSVVIRQLLDVKGFLNEVIAGLQEHKADNIALILTALHDKVVCNINISKTAKIHVFGDRVLTALSQLFNWNGMAVTEPKQKRKHNHVEMTQITQFDESSLTADQLLVRSSAHRLLMTLCTSFKYGIVFHDRTLGSGPVNANHILTNFLTSLRVSSGDPLTEDIVIKSLCACPDVLRWYLPSLRQQCLPRDSVSCLKMFRFIQKVYDKQPLISPAVISSKDLTGGQIAAVLTSTVLPPSDIWSCFISALKCNKNKQKVVKNDDETTAATDAQGVKEMSLIECMAAEMLLLVLERTAATIDTMQSYSPAATGGGDASTTTVIHMFRDSVSKAMPDMSTIVDYLEMLLQFSDNSDSTGQTGNFSTRGEVIGHLTVVMKLLCAYYSVLPAVHTLNDKLNADVLIHRVLRVTCKDDDVSCDELHLSTLRLLVLCGVPVERLLNKSDASDEVALHTVLKVVVDIKEDFFSEVIDLLHKLLQQTTLFSCSDHEELRIWLHHLFSMKSSKCRKPVMKFFVSCVERLHLSSADYLQQIVAVALKAGTLKSKFNGVSKKSLANSWDVSLEDIMNGEDIDLKVDQSCETSCLDSDHTMQLPFSGFVVAVVEALDKKKSNEKLLNYVENVLSTVIYHQKCPVALCLLLQESSVTSLLSRVGQLVNRILPSASKTDQRAASTTLVNNEEQPSVCEQVEMNFLSSEDCSKIHDLVLDSINSLSLDECVDLTRQLLAYVCSLIINKFPSVDDKLVNSVVACIDALTTVARQSVTLAAAVAQQSSIIQSAQEKDASSPYNPYVASEHHSLTISRKSSKLTSTKASDKHVSVFRHIFNSEYLFQLFVTHSTAECDSKLLKRLCKKVSIDISKLARSAVDFGVELTSVVSSGRYLDRLSHVLSSIIDGSQPWTSDLVEIVDNFWTLLPRDVLVKLLVSLVNEPSACVSQEKCALNRRGRLALRVLQLMHGEENFNSAASLVAENMFHLLKSVPTDDELCNTLRGLPVFLRIVPSSVTSVLMKSGHQTTIKLVSSLVEVNADCRKAVVRWCVSNASWKKPEVLPVYCSLIYILLRSELSKGNEDMEDFGKHVSDSCEQYLLDELCSPDTGCVAYTDSVAELFVYLMSAFSELRKLKRRWRQLGKVIKKSKSISAATEFQISVHCQLTEILCASSDTESTEAASAVCIAVMKLFIATATGQQCQCQSVDKLLLEPISRFMQKCSGDSSFLLSQLADVWSPFVTSGLKYHYTSCQFLSLLDRLIQVVYSSSSNTTADVKLTVKSLFEMVISHSEFVQVVLSQATTELKDCMLSLLLTLIKSDSTCCQTEHLVLYFSAYGASLSATDQKLLALIHLYEANGCAVSDYRPYVWGEKCHEYNLMKKSLGPTLLKPMSGEEILDLLDKSRLQQSLSYFPLSRSLEAEILATNKEESECYDPAFLLPLFVYLLNSDSVVQCSKFASRHYLGYVLTALSSHCDDTRTVAYHVLELYHGQLQSVLQQKSLAAVPTMLLHLLDTIRYSINSNNQRLPCIITTFLARAAYVLATPDDRMYCLLCEFLLLKPSLDLAHVPEFYKLFYSSSMEYKTERSWLLSIIADGLREPLDYEICERRFLLKIILTFYDSPLCDSQCQSLVLKILHQMASIKVVAWDLVKNRGILAWLIHTLASTLSDAKANDLMLLLTTLWTTLLDGRDNPSAATRQRPPPPCLPPVFTADLMLTCQTFMRKIGTFGSQEMRKSLSETLSSIRSHIDKTNKLYADRGYTNPMSELWT